ncbi:hypothetical protein [Halalkalicoccus ordinarius]|uniref:hypothetical protein n=1 Tax=Halalkalicoccus ordinarius TaxID=3116651 RepID=UPI00300EE9A4
MSMVCLPLTDVPWSVVAIIVLSSATLGFATITQSYLLVILPNVTQGAGFGLLRTISFGIGAASPVMVGALADQGFFNEPFFDLAVLSEAMTILVQRL